LKCVEAIDTVVGVSSKPPLIYVFPSGDTAFTFTAQQKLQNRSLTPTTQPAVFFKFFETAIEGPEYSMGGLFWSRFVVKSRD